MKYRMKIFYETGDSFHNEDATDYLEMTWENLDVAKFNLKRIEEHYKWYTERNKYYIKDKAPKPEWHKDLTHDFTIIIKSDEGKELQMSAFWCGHFEHLYNVEIVQAEDPDLKISF